MTCFEILHLICICRLAIFIIIALPIAIYIAYYNNLFDYITFSKKTTKNEKSDILEQ